MMTPAIKSAGERLSENGDWQFYSPQNELAQALREELLMLASKTIAGKMDVPYHRSRHAQTWRASAGGALGLRIYVKLIQPPDGTARLKRLIKGPRGVHLEAITQALIDAGFNAPAILLRGTGRNGIELIITLAADGDGPLRVLADLIGGPLARKRAILRGLGRELARLHRCGFVHGDLTPFNLFIFRGEPLCLALIDNDRTRQNPLLQRQRLQLRNLVQLGRFAVRGISRTDKLRLLHGYSEMLSSPVRRGLTRRVNAMLNRRLRRDDGLTIVTVQPESHWRTEATDLAE
jgi:Lipopolysaccharide kinase (Kdo/WaaP) family